jgi:hypothetical protein
MATEKQHAHELIEQLPPSQLSALVGLLETMVDPVSRKLAAAPVDDEPESSVAPRRVLLAGHAAFVIVRKRGGEREIGPSSWRNPGSRSRNRA